MPPPNVDSVTLFFGDQASHDSVPPVDDAPSVFSGKVEDGETPSISVVSGTARLTT